MDVGIAYDFKGVSDDSDSHKFLAVVAAVHHERVCEPFDDGTLRFSETLDGVSAGGMGDVNWRADLDVVANLRCCCQPISSI